VHGRLADQKKHREGCTLSGIHQFVGTQVFSKDNGKNIHPTLFLKVFYTSNPNSPKKEKA